MPLFTAILPANIMMVFSILMPVVMFDVLNIGEVKGFGPSEWLNYDWDRQLELESEILG